MLEFLKNHQLNALAQKMQRGDNRAAEKIFRHFHPLLFRFFVGRILNKDIAEDLTQDVFFKVISRIETYRKDSGNFSAWFWRIAKNRLVDHYREKKTESLPDYLAKTGREPRPGTVSQRPAGDGKHIAAAEKFQRRRTGAFFPAFYFRAALPRNQPHLRKIRGQPTYHDPPPEA